MRIMTHSGFFSQQNVTENELEIEYMLTDASRLLLKDNPISLTPFVQAMLDPVLTNPWHQLPTWLKNDDPTTFETTHKMLLWDYAARNSNFNNLFNESMASDARLVTNLLIEKYREVFIGSESLVDVGGGTGTTAKALAKSFPQLECVVFDLPHVVAGLQGSDNLKYVGGDMFEEIPPADAILMKWILHSWNDEKCVKILKKCKESLKQKGEEGKFVMPEGYPWGMPVGFLGEESRPVISEISHVQPTVPIPQLGNTLPQVTATVTAPLVHTIQQNQMPIFHTESVGGYDRVDDLQIKYDEIQREMRALRGKDLFGQDAHELCLIPDVVVPHKFKVPDFEKYKGSTCPKAHLIMYARKMSTQTSNDKLLIHYFQDSLTGAALRWYMDLDRANVSSFNDLASAFIRQYNYNSYLTPDRDELRALAQKESESFKEYAQRWREFAAQIRPPVEEKELFKLFLHTLSPFLYEKMVGVVSRSFAEMVEMRMCLEEGVRQGRLTREKAPTNTARDMATTFQRRKNLKLAWGPGHDVERCYPLKKAVQDLIRNKVLSFKDENPNVQSSSSA
ncbi:hypothetical protein TSUD_214470 [Trifolium subterraneum]|uniref:Retrotransposon gag domain-containing protein n=1 Tax=Trifolium subterraneum TaxID=3900 RepID=A0A2Z6NIK4_TRISU|nr:hypothetical protein TSUD_214470 [Trifolium subterraneum]